MFSKYKHDLQLKNKEFEKRKNLLIGTQGQVTGRVTPTNQEQTQTMTVAER